MSLLKRINSHVVVWGSAEMRNLLLFSEIVIVNAIFGGRACLSASLLLMHVSYRLVRAVMVGR